MCVISLGSKIMIKRSLGVFKSHTEKIGTPDLWTNEYTNNVSVSNEIMRWRR